MFLKPYFDKRDAALLPLHMITVGTEYDQKAVHRPDGSPFHHIFFVEKGEALFRTKSGSFTVGAGTVILMKKGEPVHYEPVGNCLKTGWVTFDGPAAEGLLECFRAEGFERMPENGLNALLRECAKAAERGASTARLSRLCYELVVEFFEARDYAQKHTALLQAEDFMRKNCVQDLSVSDVAAAAKVSESFLYRLFRAEGTTPVEYLRRCRLERAKRYLLENPEMRIGEIAQLCGFADAAYFCKVFRDSERMTPKAYRALQ